MTTLLGSSDAATSRSGQSQVKLLRRLLSARTAGAVAQAAVDGLRELVSADVSWCGLINGEYLAMEAHSGLRTAEMPALWRLRVGQGVGGRVASEGRTIAVRDYLHDPRRVPVMKRLIDNEDIRSGVCAPLLGGSDVLGVLYAAHRATRDWTAHETGLVTDAARDTGVALALIHEQRHERAVLDEALERAREADRALQAATATAADLARTEDIGAGISALAHHLRMHVELLDPGGELLRTASAGTPQVDQIQLVQPVGDEPLGTLCIRGEWPLTRSGVELVGLCSRLIALQVLRERAALRSETRLRCEFVDDLLARRPPDRAGMLMRAALLGVDLHDRHQVIHIGRCAGGARAAPAVSRRTVTLLEAEIAQEFPGSIVVPRDGDVLAVLATGGLEPSRVLTALRGIARRASDAVGGLAAGVGRICRGLDDLSDSGAEAGIALDLARGHDEPGTVVSGADLGFYGLLARGAAARHSLASIVERALGPILEADAANGSDYVHTLDAFLTNDRHLERTAGCLHVHPNTVRYRLGKVQELLGVNLHDVDDRFLLELALRVRSALPER